MWHEVRKQERKIRCMIVDYKRRAERRKEYYQKIKAVPNQFIRLHGQSYKIHLDPVIAAAGDSPAVMMNWRGEPDNNIDRFDVRAHLDYIPEYKCKDEQEEISNEERLINYERYRILVQNDFLGVSEEKFLRQLALEEQFGAVATNKLEIPLEGKKKIPGAAIGYNYDDPSVQPQQVPSTSKVDNLSKEEESSDEDSDVDFDVCVDVNKVTTAQAHELNNCSHIYGMKGNDFFSYLTKDKEEADNLKLARELEEEKAMYSGRKSRRERRAYREKKLAGRKISPPSYASREDPADKNMEDLKHLSRSRSSSPETSGQITYITSFGSEEQPAVVPLPPKKSHDSKRLSKRKSTSPRVNRRRRRYSSSSSDSNYKSSRNYYSAKERRSDSTDSNSHRSKSRNLSRSGSPKKRSEKSNSNTPSAREQMLQPLPRYYGRKKDDSSSELSITDDEDDQHNKNNDRVTGTNCGNSSSRTKAPLPGKSCANMSLIASQKQRLKRKMQLMLNRQYKADKKAEKERTERAEQERIDREDEMREISIKLRKRERMKRHELLTRRSSYSSRSDSNSSKSKSRSRSRSRTPIKHKSPTYYRDERRTRDRRRSRSWERERQSRRTRSRTRSRSRDRRHYRSRSRSRSRSRQEKYRPTRPLVDY